MSPFAVVGSVLALLAVLLVGTVAGWVAPPWILEATGWLLFACLFGLVIRWGVQR